TVVLDDLHIQPTGAQPPWVPAFGATNDAGALRIESCTITSVTLSPQGVIGQIAVDLQNDSNVSLAASTLQGGRGSDGWYYHYHGSPGGFALSAQNSQVAVWDCILRGGDGGTGAQSGSVNDSGDGGRGGSGCRVSDGLLIVANSQVYGGDGGDGGAG